MTGPLLRQAYELKSSVDCYDCTTSKMTGRLQIRCVQVQSGTKSLLLLFLDNGAVILSGSYVLAFIYCLWQETTVEFGQVSLVYAMDHFDDILVEVCVYLFLRSC